MPDPILDLTTLRPDDTVRPLLRVDGIEYQLAVRNDFSVMQLSKIERLGARLTQLVTEEEAAGDSGDEKSADREREVSDLYGRILGQIILGTTPEVVERWMAPAGSLGRLSDADRVAIVIAFLGTSVLQQTKPRNRAERRASRRTGEKSSPD